MNGKREKFTSTWNPENPPSICHAKRFYRKKVAPPWQRPAFAPRGAVLASACSFNFISACRYTWTVFNVSCPSQSAMTARSTPACSNSIAAVWRSTWGEMRFVFSDGQRFAAVRVWRPSKYSTPSRLRELPRAFGNAAASGGPLRSRNHRIITDAVSLSARRLLFLQ